MRWLRFLLLLMLCLFITGPLFFLFFALEKSPEVRDTDVVNTEKILRVKYLANRTLKQLFLTSAAPVLINVSESDLNSLMAVAARAVNRLEGRVTIRQSEFHAAMTVRVPRNPIGNFMNIGVWMHPSESGLNLSRVTIGRVKIPGNIALAMLRVIADIVLGNDNGTVALNAVQSVTFMQDTIVLRLKQIPDIVSREEQIIQRLNRFLNTVPLTAPPETVRLYYVKLTEVEKQKKPGQTVSLAYLIGPLFQLAMQRSVENEAADENKAALLALAIYAGDSRIENFIGKVRTGALESHKMQFRHVLLSGREDLMLHFVISSALEIITASGITYAIGEFKELLDARRGGSGFSFVDLAADMTGKRFAERATNSATARDMQAVLAGRVYEEDIFPRIKDLPEDLSQAEFERTYGSVRNERYLSVVRKIEERISRLPAYAVRD